MVIPLGTLSRSAAGFWLNLMSGLIAYSRQFKKPSIYPPKDDLDILESPY